jgi:asparagine synthase (glutamine-hydrolysing)
MCGIGGAHGLGEPLPDAIIDAVRRLPSVMRHRGPDEAGSWVAPDRSAALAATRLAVRDLRPEGNQPFETRLGATVYNGELYRWPSERTLTGGGWALRTSTDTEIVHAIMCGDPRLFTQAEGMYAAATWRCDTGSLWLARDRMGEKPLYVVESDRWLAFGSELKALVAVGLLDRDIEPDALALFLRLGHVPEPWTIYRRARPLPPGSVVEVTRAGVQRTRLRLAPAIESNGRGRAGGLRNTIVGAVNDAMVADVPTGIFLSGGVDSSVVAAAAVAGGHHPLAMTLSAPRWADEEATAAAHTAKYLGLPHQTVVIDPPRALDDLGAFFAAMDQPTVDGFNSFLIAKAGRESGLTVALSGVGGDELFRGYSTFKDMSRLRLGRRVPGIGPAVRMLGGLGRRPLVAERVADAMGARSALSRYVARRGVFGTRSSAAILGRAIDWDAMLARLPQVPDSVASAGDDPETAWLETTFYLRNQLLRDIDVFSMAHSLEVRAPLLLPDVVALGLGLKDDHSLRDKTVLRSAFRDDLPAEALLRPKRGFGLPWDSWLRGGFAGPVETALRDSRFSADNFYRPCVDRLHSDFIRGRAHWSSLWSLAVLCLWDDAQQHAPIARPS